jgi:hypothetical protein
MRKRALLDLVAPAFLIAAGMPAFVLWPGKLITDVGLAIGFVILFLAVRRA